MTKETIISVKNLSKSFGKKEVLTDISFELYQGDCLALIGPNGAGKTVLMSCLLGDYRISSGQISLLGYSARDRQLKEKLGILFQDNIPMEKLKVKELLDFQRAIYKEPLSLEQIDDLLGFSDQQKHQLISKLSGGQRRLLSFVQVLVGQPDLIFLDEPTAGMDTSTRKRFWEIIDQLKEAGKTIIYSSHYIEEVEHTADRILVLNQGQLLRDTTPHHLRAEEKEKVFTLPRSYHDLLAKQPIYDVVLKPDTISFTTREVRQIWQVLEDVACPIEEIEMTNRTLLNSIFDSRKDGSHEHL